MSPPISISTAYTPFAITDSQATKPQSLFDNLFAPALAEAQQRSEVPSPPVEWHPAPPPPKAEGAPITADERPKAEETRHPAGAEDHAHASSDRPASDEHQAHDTTTRDGEHKASATEVTDSAEPEKEAKPDDTTAAEAQVAAYAAAQAHAGEHKPKREEKAASGDAKKSDAHPKVAAARGESKTAANGNRRDSATPSTSTKAAAKEAAAHAPAEAHAAKADKSTTTTAEPTTVAQPAVAKAGEAVANTVAAVEASQPVEVAKEEKAEAKPAVAIAPATVQAAAVTDPNAVANQAAVVTAVATQGAPRETGTTEKGRAGDTRGAARGISGTAKNDNSRATPATSTGGSSPKAATHATATSAAPVAAAEPPAAQSAGRAVDTLKAVASAVETAAAAERAAPAAPVPPTAAAKSEHLPANATAVPEAGPTPARDGNPNSSPSAANAVGGGSGPAQVRDVDRMRLIQRVAKAFQVAQQRGEEPVRLRLSPPELGAVRVEVVFRDGGVYAQLHAETPAAQQALLENMPALRERLADQNMRLERFDVNLMDQSTPDTSRQSQGDRDSSTYGRALENSVRRTTVASQSSVAVPSTVRTTADGSLNVVI